jgi:hypothetical protein
MTATEPLPVIRRIDTDRADLCALEIVGHFTAADLQNAYGILEAAYTDHEKIDLFVRVSYYDGFDWDVASSGATIRGKVNALRHIRKYAVVGGPTWVRAIISIFAPLTSVKTKHFDAADEAAAWEWIGGHPV